MSDLDRYLTDEVRDAALVVAGSRYRQLYALAHDPAVARLVNSVAEDVLAAVLPDIIQQAKAEGWAESAQEAHDLGWLHGHAHADVARRNPYRADRIEQGGQP